MESLKIMIFVAGMFYCRLWQFKDKLVGTTTVFLIDIKLFVVWKFRAISDCSAPVTQ